MTTEPWWCFRCKAEFPTLSPMATAQYCPVGHPMRRVVSSTARKETQKMTQQLELFDGHRVLAYQVGCSGTADIIYDQVGELVMHGQVVLVVVGTVDEVKHKTTRSGDIVRVGTVRVSDIAVVQGEMCASLVEMYSLNVGQLAFDLPGSPLLPTAAAPPADPTTGEVIGSHDPALAAFLAQP